MDRSALARATDNSEAPTPGYLYKDIARNAATSPVVSGEIATYLTRRLGSNSNHNVKTKCLKVLAKVAQDPMTRGQFKRAAAQNATAMSAIKEALNFRGPPDAVRGDEIYQRVRGAAKEALDAIYSDTPAPEPSGMMGGGPGMGAGVSSSYGSSPYASSGVPVTGAPRMEGIGNPQYQDPRLDSQGTGIANMTLGQVVAVTGQTLKAIYDDPLAKKATAPPPSHGGSGSSMQGYGGGGYGAPPGRNELASATNNQWTMASNRGPNAVAPPQNFNQDRDAAYFKARDSGSNAFQWAQGGNAVVSNGGVGGVGGTWGATASKPANSAHMSVAAQSRAQAHAPTYPTHSTGGVVSGAGGSAASDGSYEKNLIMELCPPGGMRAEPPQEKLEAFKRAVPSLDADLVCPALLDALEDGQPWIIKAKALCVIEACIKVGESSEDGHNAYADFFHACGAEIEPLASHPRSAIKEPAKRVVKALGIELTSSWSQTKPDPALPVAAPAPASVPSVPPPEPPNLLDFGDPTPVAPTVAPPPAPAAPPTTVAPPAPTTSQNSLFGGLTIQQSSAPAAAPVAPVGFDSILNQSPAPVAPPPAPAAGSNLFGDLGVKEPPNGNAQVNTAPPSASGSAFGFITGGGGSETTEAAPAAMAPAAPKETFDPLLSLGPVGTSAQPTSMALNSPEMQAIAYQQKMVLMQQQMQQMQMALAMQQQGGKPLSSRNVMMPRPVMGGTTPNSSFSFLDNTTVSTKKETKSFDFVKDAMKSANGPKGPK